MAMRTSRTAGLSVMVMTIASFAHAQEAKLSTSALPEAPMAKVHSATAYTTPPATEFPTVKQQFRSFLYDSVGPGAFIGAGIQSGIDQGRSLRTAHPAHGLVPEWGGGLEGYGKRYGSRFGEGLINNSTKYGLAAVLREDVSYHACECSGMLPRISHAAISAFTARTRSGRIIPSAPALVGPIAAGQVAVLGWYPARYEPQDGLRDSWHLYIGGVVGNIVREFTKR